MAANPGSTSGAASGPVIGSPIGPSVADQAFVHATLADLAAGRSVSEDVASGVFERLLGGQLDAAQIGALFALLQVRLPTVDEVVGGARAMRRHVTGITLPAGAMPDQVLDTCGTGGTEKFLNVSTLAAIVIAAAGAGTGESRVLVAKHGNRSRSGRGSAEILEALGVAVDADAATQARCLEKVGISFSFAIHHHPAMKFAGPARRAVGFPTIFNILGPLTNPAGARCQVIGVYRPELVSIVAGALARLGVRRALVVHGEVPALGQGQASGSTGCDELSIMGRTVGALVQSGVGGAVGGGVDGAVVSGWECEPEGAGVRRGDLRQYAGLDLAGATALARQVLDGQESPALEVVVLNAGAGLWVSGAADSLAAGVELARQAIATGRGRQTLQRWVDETKK